MRTIAWSAVEAWSTELLQGLGLRDDDARAVVESLLYAERRGVQSHGLIRLPTYVDRIRAGGINPRPSVQWLTDVGAFAIMSADAGPGAATARVGVDSAVARARKFGIGCVLARNANHFGAAGYLAERVADADAIGIVACNTDAVMCAPYGGRPVLGTNPIAIAVPVGEAPRPVLDMATTEASYGKLVVAAQEHRDVPAGWAVDADGFPTTDPNSGLGGALLPSGGPKGFGLAFMVDAIVALSGARVSPVVSPLYGDPSQPQGLGHLFIALDAAVTGSLPDYFATVAALIDAVHLSGPGPDDRPALVPGEPELSRAIANSEGIQLSPQQWAELVELGRTTSSPFPTDGTEGL